MEKALVELLASQKIAEVLYRLACGTDRGDPELYASVQTNIGALRIFHSTCRSFRALVLSLNRGRNDRPLP